MELEIKVWPIFTHSSVEIMRAAASCLNQDLQDFEG